jgi:hypothetical protein
VHAIALSATATGAATAESGYNLDYRPNRRWTSSDGRAEAMESLDLHENQPAVPATASRAGSVWGKVLLLALGGALVLTLAVFYALSAVPGTFERIASYITGRSTTFDISSPSVVERIRQLSRLETVEYSLDKIVEGDRQSPILPDFLVGDKILLVAHGEIIAGVDLGQLKPGDVSVKSDSVHVHLPAPQILTTRIDNGRTRVYSRITGLLVHVDPNLESEVRRTAEQQIAQAAIDDGILDKARQNARSSVTALLYGLGFHTVDVQ